MFRFEFLSGAIWTNILTLQRSFGLWFFCWCLEFFVVCLVFEGCEAIPSGRGNIIITEIIKLVGTLNLFPTQGMVFKSYRFYFLLIYLLSTCTCWSPAKWGSVAMIIRDGTLMIIREDENLEGRQQLLLDKWVRTNKLPCSIYRVLTLF